MMAAATDPDRELEFANEAWAAADLDGLVAHLSAAIRGFSACGDNRPAAMACVQLGNVFANYLGNLTASRAWFTRATRLVENEPPCIEQGWVAVAAMGCDVDDPATLLSRAELALDRARRFGNLNLEAKALADGGLAHVRLGHVAEGMAWLDEAMALVCGPADDIETASKSVCAFFTACYATGEFERAGSWNSLLRQYGLMGEVRGAPIFLRSHCDSVHATLLFELGRWGEAEEVLTRAIADFETLNQSPSWHPALALADLRIHQGRHAEAEVLILGKDAWLEGLLPATRLHLARGEYELALAAANRGLRAVGPDRMRAATLLALIVDARLALGDVDAAAEAADEMDRRAAGLDLAALHARNHAVRARLTAARGDLDGAVASLRAGVEELDTADMPWFRATLLLELALRLEEAGDRSGATVEARAAARVLAALDVVLLPHHLDILTRLGESSGRRARPSPAVAQASLTREDRWWVAEHGATQVRLADSKGLRYVAELVARPGVERHALDLVDRVEGVAPAGEGLDRRQLGDAGELIDSRARATYRRRIEELRGEVDDALALDDLDRAEALQGELDQFVAQLSQAFGLGGRVRKASSGSERARLNVTRAIRAATLRLVDALPGAGAALDRHIRTGLYCVYDPPGGDDEIPWIVQ